MVLRFNSLADNSTTVSTTGSADDVRSYDIGDQLLRNLLKQSTPIRIEQACDPSEQAEVFKARYRIMYEQFKVRFKECAIRREAASILDEYEAFSDHLRVEDPRTGKLIGGSRVLYLGRLPEHLLCTAPGVVFPKMYERTRPSLPRGFSMDAACIVGYLFGEKELGNCTYNNLVSTMGDLLIRQSFQHAKENGCRWILATCKSYMHAYLLRFGFEEICRNFPLAEIEGTERALLILDTDKVTSFFSRERRD